jgi:hypothetical protein
MAGEILDDLKEDLELPDSLPVVVGELRADVLPMRFSRLPARITFRAKERPRRSVLGPKHTDP